MIEQKEIAVVEKEAVAINEQAKAIQITNDQQNEAAANFLLNIKTIKTKIKETFRPHIEAANKVWKGLLAEEKKHLGPVEEAEAIIKERMSLYYTEVEKAKKAEQDRLLAEAKAKEDKRKADLEAQAKAWEAKGNTEKAEERRQQAEEVAVIAPIIETAPEKPQGIQYVSKWNFQITDEAQIPREYLMVDDSKIRKYVGAMKKDAKIPGVRVYETKEVRGRNTATPAPAW